MIKLSKILKEAAWTGFTGYYLLEVSVSKQDDINSTTSKVLNVIKKLSSNDFEIDHRKTFDDEIEVWIVGEKDKIVKLEKIFKKINKDIYTRIRKVRDM